MYSIVLTQNGGMILGPIAKLLGWILEQLYNFLTIFHIENVGLTIILFTFIVNALMIPLTIKQQKFSKLSARMNPEIQKVQAKYKGKKDQESLQKQNLEMQAIYQKYGTNPTGGCLTLLITLPIMFALYRVIYAIPAYVPQIFDAYDKVAQGVMADPNYFETLRKISETVHVSTFKWDEVGNVLTNVNIIDLLSQFKSVHWNELVSAFPSVATAVNNIHDINNIGFGLSVVDAPSLKSISILIPIMAGGFQYLQTKMMTPPSTGDDANPAAATMKSMNTVMPIMSGVMCFMMPIGVGLYWVAGSVFRIIQQFFVDKFFDKMDVDELIQKNAEKSNKKKAKLGIDPNTSMQEYAKQRTASIEDKTKAVAKNQNATKKSNYEPSDYKKSEVSYKAGSIAANAHLLNNRNKADKGDN